MIKTTAQKNTNKKQKKQLKQTLLQYLNCITSLATVVLF
jgi:hypothetical protein